MSSLDEMFVAAAGLEQLSSDGLRLIRLASIVDLVDPGADVDTRVTADAYIRAVEAVLRRRGQPFDFPGRRRAQPP